MQNTTSLLLFSVTYMIIFGFLLGLTGVGCVVIDIDEVVVMAIITVGLAIAAGAISAGLTNWDFFGSGPEAGEFVWKGALFGAIALWATWFAGKMAGLMPSGTPTWVYVLFLGPPVVGVLWGMFATFLKSGMD